MNEYCDYFKDKRITLMGLGLLGRGVGDARFLAECGADLLITDLKSEEELRPSLEQLKEFPNIHYVLGEHRVEDFHDRDLVIYAAGVALDSLYLSEARRNKIPITISTALFARLAGEVGASIVGITGTRGKSTVAHMLFAILQKGGVEVLLGGNVQGVSTLAMLPQVSKNTVLVLELDSWQLQGFREEKISPHVAVFTTFYPDHMNYYHHDMDLYLADKAEIFLHQKPNDTLVLGEQCMQIVQGKYAGAIKSHIIIAHADGISQDWRLQIPGEHNRANAACARAAARAVGVEDADIRTALGEFRGVPGRLQFVREINGVKIYNDNSATTPDATIAALHAFGNKKNIVLLMGGTDKELDMSNLIKEIPIHCKAVVLLQETGTEKINKEIFDLKDIQLAEENSLEHCVAKAAGFSEPGDILLFSPAFASFGKWFKNEYDRGEQFINLISALQ